MRDPRWSERERTYCGGGAVLGKRPGKVIGDLVELFVGGDGSSCGHILHQAIPFLRAKVLAGRDVR